MTQPFRKTQLRQVWLTGPVCTTFIPAYLNNSTSYLPLHPCLLDQFLLRLFSADPGIMAPMPGPMVDVVTVTAVRSVEESMPVLTAPYWP